jgi:hypothetical protein
MMSTTLGSNLARRDSLEVVCRTRRIAAHAASVCPLRDAKQREPGLRIVSQLTRLAIRVLRFYVLASQPMDLAASIQRDARGLATRTRLAIARATRVLERSRPFAVRLMHLGAMHEAQATEPERLGLPVAPASERVGPLASPA